MIEDEQKILKCSFPTEWNKKPITVMPIHQLWASVPIATTYRGQPFFENVKTDISENGLHFPLLVVECTYAQLVKQKERHKKSLLDLPPDHLPTDTMYVIWGGSNRLSIARDLGYTHVDCVIYPLGNFAAAFTDQAAQRVPYSRFYAGKHANQHKIVSTRKLNGK